MSSTTAFISSSLSPHILVCTPRVSTYLCNFILFILLLSLEICLEYKLKVLLQSQTMSYYIVYIDI